MAELKPYLAVADARAAVEWYVEHLGAEVVVDPVVMPDGRVGHVELEVAEAGWMMADEHPEIQVEGPDRERGNAVTLHLDLGDGRDVDDRAERMVAGGAVLDRGPEDTPVGRVAVLRDPFGHRWMLNGAVRSGPRLRARSSWFGVVLDAADGPALAHFYERLLGWTVFGESPEWTTLAPSRSRGYNMAFATERHYVRPVWPTVPGQPQMMSHLDLQVDDLEEAVAFAVSVGAEQASYQPQHDVRVMLDPAGHPFCLYL